MIFRVITDAPGQTCNRFWSYVDSIGWAIANNAHVYILYWDKSIKDYDLLRNGKYVSFPLYNANGIDKIGYDKYNYLSHRLFPNNKLASMFCYKTRIAPSLGFIQGWETRGSVEYLAKYKEKIVSQFLPNKEIRDGVQELFAKYRAEGYFIIGVHMRKGDYEFFLNGKYFFSLEQYKEFMAQLKHLYYDRKLCFYISTNERYDIKDFVEFVIMPPSMQNVSYDLYALGLCDRIIGPISTFSRWASFVGNVPLCFLRKRMVLADDRMFSPIKDYYHFANGKEILSVKSLEDRYEKYVESMKR